MRLRDKPPREPSFEKIDDADLQRLADIALAWLNEDLLRPGSKWASYRLLLICLVQGAAQHYADASCGVNDFDALILLCPPEGESTPGCEFPNRLVVERDFGDPKFGRHSVRNPEFVGRTVDLLVRAIDCSSRDAPINIAKTYFQSARSASAWHWRRRAIYALYPENLRGTKIWPQITPTQSSSKSAGSI
jgi:hypothetical protein